MVLLIAFLTKVNDSEKHIITVLNESDYFGNEFITTETTSYINFKNISLEKALDSTISMGNYGLLVGLVRCEIQEKTTTRRSAACF